MSNDASSSLGQLDFSKGRLRCARRSRGETLKGLATAIGVNEATVARYESGQKRPTYEHQEAIARHLGYPLAYFYSSPLEEVSERAISFRSRRDTSATIKGKVIARSMHASGLISKLFRSRFRLPDACVPDYQGHDPEFAAGALREEWGLGRAPLGN